MMKIGIESAAYISRYGLAEGLRKMKAHGYECVDYQDFIHTETELFRVSDAEFERRLLEEKTAYAEAGIEIFQTHGPWRYPPQDGTEEDRTERFEKMAKSVYGTRLLGCKNFVIHPIMPYGPGANPEPERFMELNYAFMEKLCGVGRENGVVINLENMPFPALSLSRASEILEFVKNMNSEWLRVCLDTGHCVVCGESPAEAVRMIGKEYLCTLHVHDNNGADLHWIPYTGKIDWDGFTAALLEIGYDGAMSLETAIPGKIPAEARELQEISLFRIAKKIAGRS